MTGDLERFLRVDVPWREQLERTLALGSAFVDAIVDKPVGRPWVEEQFLNGYDLTGGEAVRVTLGTYQADSLSGPWELVPAGQRATKRYCRLGTM